MPWPVNRLPFRRAAVMVSMSGVGALAALLFLPVNRRPFSHDTAEKLLGYEEAVSAIKALAAAAPATVRRNCTLQLLEHGRPTERVFVLLHGLSNCPAQFSELGRQLFERGHNVLIPLLPYHGRKTDWRPSGVALLATVCLKVETRLPIWRESRPKGCRGQPFGQRCHGGLDGTKSKRLIQNGSPCSVFCSFQFTRLDLDTSRASPSSTSQHVFLVGSPAKENLAGPPYAYPRFPTRVIGETMFLGRVVLDESRVLPPQCPSILTVTSASDIAANNIVTEQLVANWRALRPAGIETFEFPADQQIPHDFIDPNQTNQRIDLVCKDYRVSRELDFVTT